MAAEWLASPPRRNVSVNSLLLASPPERNVSIFPFFAVTAPVNNCLKGISASHTHKRTAFSISMILGANRGVLCYSLGKPMQPMGPAAEAALKKKMMAVAMGRRRSRCESHLHSIVLRFVQFRLARMEMTLKCHAIAPFVHILMETFCELTRECFSSCRQLLGMPSGFVSRTVNDFQFL